MYLSERVPVARLGWSNLDHNSIEPHRGVTPKVTSRRGSRYATKANGAARSKQVPLGVPLADISKPGIPRAKLMRCRRSAWVKP